MRFETVALIVAAGRGERAGGAGPKQFRPIAGVPVIARAIDGLAGLPVFVVIGDGQAQALADAIGDREIAGTVIGGATRQQSVSNGLDAIAAAGGADKVLVHDAARPLLPLRVRDALIAALDDHDGVVPVLPVADSVARAGDLLGDPVDRSGLVRVQTPQAFRFDALRNAHARWAGDPATDDAQVARAAGMSVAWVEGDVLLEKITHPADFTRAEAMLAAAHDLVAAPPASTSTV